MTRIEVGHGLWTNPAVGFTLEKARLTEGGLWALQITVDASVADAVYFIHSADEDGDPAFFAQNLRVPAGEFKVFPFTMWINAGEYLMAQQNLASWVGQVSVSIIGVKLPER